MAHANENFAHLQAGYLFPEVARRINAWSERNPGEKVLRLSIGNTTEAIPPSIAQAMKDKIDALSDRDTYTGYGDEQGDIRLREALRNHYRNEYGVDLPADAFFVSDGAKSDAANIQSIFSSKSIAAVQDPAYPVYVDSNVAGGHTGVYDKASDGYSGIIYMKSDESNGFVASPPDTHADIIYLCFPNNPTGAVATRDQLRAFVDYAHREKSVIIFDAAYCDYIQSVGIPHSIYEIEGAEEIGAATPNLQAFNPPEHDFGTPDIMSLDDIEFAYCTEFFVINIFKKTTLADIDRLREYLNTIGDSIIVIGDLELIKVHVHTNKPGKALSYALTLGEIDKIKIENMLEQNRVLKAQYEANKKPLGVLSICAGDGFSAIFKDLLADQVIEGGQTMNPSADDIARAINRINAESVIVLPNNKNIILAAEQSRALVPNRNVYVVPSKDVPQGLAAILAYNSQIKVDVNLEAMTKALSTVRSASVTYAVRNTNIDGLSLKQGDIIVIPCHLTVHKKADRAFGFFNHLSRCQFTLCIRNISLVVNL